MASLSNFHQELLTHWSSDIWVKWSFLFLGVPYAGTFGCGCGLRMMVTLCLLALWDELGFFASPEVILFMFSHQETCHKKPSIILGDVHLLGVHLPFGTGWKKHISLVNAIAEGIKCLSALPETALYDCFFRHEVTGQQVIFSCQTQRTSGALLASFRLDSSLGH